MSVDATIRDYAESDYAAVADVYRDAVMTQARTAYTNEQVTMWASYPEGGDDFRRRLARGGVVVAEVAGVLAAFGQLEPGDHVAFLYCQGAYARRGLSSAIYAELEKRARAAGVASVHTEASRISRPFFEKHGFSVLEVEQAVRGDVIFERFKMRKGLRAE